MNKQCLLPYCVSCIYFNEYINISLGIADDRWLAIINTADEVLKGNAEKES